MNAKIQKPILVGGVGLSLVLWLFSILDQSLFHHTGDFIFFLIAICTGVFLLQPKDKKPNLPLQQDIDKKLVEKAIADVETIINVIDKESENHVSIPKLRTEINQLTSQFNREKIKIAITGGKGVGKSTLAELLTDCEGNFSLEDTPALFTETNQERLAMEKAIASDLVLLLINGDLTDTEYLMWQKFKNLNQGVLVVLNKEDRYLPEAREMILENIKKRGIDIISISANPQPIKVRKEQENNTFEEWLEEPETDITPLISRMNEIFSQVGEKLILATNWRETLNLKHDAKTVLNQIRKEKSLPIIEQYQWIAAGTSFANPIIALDLLANVAINGQMIIDLGEIYQQKLSLDQAKTAARTLGETMLKLGLVELSTNTIGHLLKTNAITYLAGGLTQGISAAYLTRVAGLSLIEYFQTQEINNTTTSWNWDKLSVTIKSIFEQNQRIEFLQNFVKQVAGKILPQYS